MTHDKTASLRAAIEHAGYYPALITDAVTAATGPQPVTAYLVHHGALLDEDKVSRHLTVLALTHATLICSHTDEYPPHGPDSAQPRAETPNGCCPAPEQSIWPRRTAPADLPQIKAGSPRLAGSATRDPGSQVQDRSRTVPIFE